MGLIQFLENRRFIHFLPYDSEELLEMFDASIKPFKTNDCGWADFERSFIVDNTKYTFIAEFKGDELIVGFHTNNDFSYTPTRSKINSSKVFAGVFECVKELVLKHSRKYLTFSTEIVKELRDPNNPDKGFKTTVVDIYKSKRFKDYVQQRFGFESFKEKSTSDVYACQYKLASKLESTYLL